MFEQTLEELAFGCLRVGRQLGSACQKAEIVVPNEMTRDFHHLMERLSEGEILCIKELQSLEELRVLIKDAMNELHPGFGDREFTRHSDAHDIMHPELTLLHHAMVYYKELVYRHSLVQDRLTAMRWMRFKERQARTLAI
ncbi:hypothetical protein [Shimia thalassica]|uniref:hypothetical protein n=1 Tax=Shimia thalassica TaxID=1715693 RepID=UPI0026E1E0F3|nr:hypothetical protein [Shimia thalassica]MDO6799199.1 hypothetical protein [Shimia thalassica]